MLITSRTLGEYRAMFALTEADLARRMLDCPGGTASFTAEGNAAGGNVIACDPIYAQHTPDELAARSVSETERGNGYVRAHPEQSRWSFFADPDEHLRSRVAAGARFAVDMRSHPGRYVAGRLPELPFVQASFDLVLSSHLLFSYADRLDLTFHRAAIGELMRVARDELRIFPLVAMGSALPYPLLDELLDQLVEHDITGRVVAVDYEFQAGGSQMLVCRHTRSRAEREDDHVAR
ncbi:MAG: hypothetical protein JO287_22065 [Pseudonocardiales bacterium]|nr:hypothetical protein [Pseudonocardiales bacterium]